LFISGDLDEFQGENDGGRQTVEFYDYFPDVEDAARQYTLERCSQKSADFTVIDLANFIDQKDYETTNTPKREFFIYNTFFSYIF
jgi:glucokinase